MKDTSAPGHSDSAQGSAQDLSHHPSLRDFVNVVLSYAMAAEDAEYFWCHLEGRARDPWVARECWCVSAALGGAACMEHSPACG